MPTAAERLARMVDYSCAILARTRPIHSVIRGAADKEAFAAALGSRLLKDRLKAQTERVRRHLGDDLRKGLSATDAGERYCALAGPDLYYTLTVELGWTADQHRSWLNNLLATELLGERPQPEGTAAAAGQPVAQEQVVAAPPDASEVARDTHVREAAPAPRRARARRHSGAAGERAATRSGTARRPAARRSSRTTCGPASRTTSSWPRARTSSTRPPHVDERPVAHRDYLRRGRHSPRAPARRRPSSARARRARTPDGSGRRRRCR